MTGRQPGAADPPTEQSTPDNPYLPDPAVYGADVHDARWREGWDAAAERGQRNAEALGRTLDRAEDDLTRCRAERDELRDKLEEARSLAETSRTTLGSSRREPGEHPARADDEHTAHLGGPCPECGHPGPHTRLGLRPDMVECAHQCGTWQIPGLDPAITAGIEYLADNRQQWKRAAVVHGCTGVPCTHEATTGDHAAVHGLVLRDQTAGDLGIAGGPPDAYRSGPGQQEQDDEPTSVDPWTVTLAWTPHQNFGRVSVLPSRSPVFAVFGQLTAGDPPDEVADDYGIPPVAARVLDKLRGEVQDDEQDDERTPPTEPGHQRIADAIRNTLDGADLQVVLWRAGEDTPVTDGVARLARVLDKAGLIDWAAFDRQGDGDGHG